MHQSLIPSQEVETELQAFVRENNLAGHIETACRFIAELFEVEGPVVIEKEQDPEFFDESVSLRIRAHGDMESLLRAYDQFTLRMVESLPEQASRKISFSFGTV